MKDFLIQPNLTLIMHNGIRWDVPNLERVLNIKIKARIIDTLPLSWYLYPYRNSHGLESWGEDFGVPKPKVVDWENEKLEVYINRCEEDVRITNALLGRITNYLSVLYSTDTPLDLPIVSYLAFKLDCAREQEQSRWKVDLNKCLKGIEELEAAKAEKEEALRQVMPPVKKYTEKTYPLKPFKKDGTLSVQGAKWKKYLLDQGLKSDHTDPILVYSHSEIPNPSSSQQIKDWLFSLGWEPETFKFVKDEDGSERKIPQVKKLNEPELCDSVIRLIEVQPNIEMLEGLSVINHRLGILKGFRDNADEEGFIQAKITGLTNTLRFKHTVAVNLPGVAKPYGELVRGCLVARDGHILVGSDMSGLEDATKRHFMWDYDPDYVKEMSRPDYDPHLDLALTARAITTEDLEFYNWASKENKLDEKSLSQFKRIKSLRTQYKVTNYSAIYGVGSPKLSRELKVSKKEAQSLLDAYWAKNWSVRQLAEDLEVKEFRGQKWLYNPVSKFWYSLRAEKDRFSTLNQGTGVYCFDRWIYEIRKVRPQLTAQFHDEIIIEIKDGYFEKAKKLLQDSIEIVNEKLKLNVTLGIDIKKGYRYSDIH